MQTQAPSAGDIAEAPVGNEAGSWQTSRGGMFLRLAGVSDSAVAIFYLLQLMQHLRSWLQKKFIGKPVSIPWRPRVVGEVLRTAALTQASAWRCSSWSCPYPYGSWNGDATAHGLSQSFRALVQLEKLICNFKGWKIEQPDGFLRAGGRGAPPMVYNVLMTGV